MGGQSIGADGFSGPHQPFDLWEDAPSVLHDLDLEVGEAHHVSQFS